MTAWCVMKAGDLVNFFSSFDFFREKYESKNPGVVLWVGKSGGWSSVGSRGKSAKVMWADGTETTEHLGYLEEVTKNG